jgi:putative ABC transport system permease protein
MSSFRRDVGFAIRTLIKSPVFSLTALVTIALGIGATTAIFSVINTVLLQPLPYDNRERLAYITGDMTARNVMDFPMAPADFADLITTVKAFDEVSGLVTFQQAMIDDRGEGRMLRMAGVTPNIFRTLGTRVALGRDFVAEDGLPIGPPPGQAPPVAGAAAPPPPPATTIISHEFWQQQFGGDTSIIGSTFPIGNQQAEVVGILEPSVELLWFEGSDIERRPEVYVTLRQNFAEGSRTNVFLRDRPVGSRADHEWGAAGGGRAGAGPACAFPYQGDRRCRLAHRADAPVPGVEYEAIVMDADGGGGVRAAHCVRERGQPAAGANEPARA